MKTRLESSAMTPIPRSSFPSPGPALGGVGKLDSCPVAAMANPLPAVVESRNISAISMLVKSIYASRLNRAALLIVGGNLPDFSIFERARGTNLQARRRCRQGSNHQVESASQFPHFVRRGHPAGKASSNLAAGLVRRDNLLLPLHKQPTRTQTRADCQPLTTDSAHLLLSFPADFFLAAFRLN